MAQVGPEKPSKHEHIPLAELHFPFPLHSGSSPREAADGETDEQKLIRFSRRAPLLILVLILILILPLALLLLLLLLLLELSLMPLMLSLGR